MRLKPANTATFLVFCALIGVSSCGDGQIVSGETPTSVNTGGSTPASTIGGNTAGSGNTTGGPGTTAGTSTGGSSSAGSTGGACTPDTWANYAQSWFSTNCVACHTTLTTYSAVTASKDSIRTAVSNGTMPMGKTLTAADRARAIKWMDCGMPQ